ncbi:DUF5592 family protein [Lactobacillus taiwanensis]|uniref:DUF5592 family protein n=1 Tax=Lactobacillus taiwanensis TaxID=508451 RepID=UPI00241C0AE1|nr:DUF5592 family protein [Lactobacillus taiwanensis]
MNKYSVREMVIPRTTKVVVTVFMFNIVDLLIVFFVTMFGVKLSSAIPANPIFKLLMVLASLMVGIFCTSRSIKNPGIRQWKTVIWAITEDRGKYYPIRYEKRKKHARI